MANALYPYYKQTCLDRGNTDGVDMNSDDIKCAAFDSTAAYDDAHKYLGDLLGAHADCVIGRSGNVTSPTVVDGTFDCDDPTIADVPVGKTIVGYVAFKDTGDDSTSTVIAWIDTDSSGDAINLPGNGSDVQITMDADGLFDL